MDHDFDIEMGDVDGFATHGHEMDDTLAIDDDILPADDAQEPGEVEEATRATGNAAEETTLVPNKVYIRGLDTMNPEDIKSYFNGHSGGARFQRIEWIDDTSANLLFDSSSAATDAVVFLSAIDVADPSNLPPRELLPAKPYPAKPDITLQVRLAVVADRKITGAASRSRFYLLNPEYDPEERRRRGDCSNGRLGSNRYRERDSDYDRRYYRRHGGGRYDDRYEDESVEHFDVSLYDDDEVALAKRSGGGRRPRSRSRSRPRSGGSGSDRDARRDNRGKELFPALKRNERVDSRLGASRNRSASPARSDRDGDVRMDDENRGASSRNRDSARALKDRLSSVTATSNRTKELFPSKLSAGVGSKAQMDQVDKVDLISKRLSDRITPRAQTPVSNDDGSLNIRGIAKTQNEGGAGIFIKGRATARELFPEKFGNAGKELFAEKLEGRGRPRRKAEDSFY